ARASTPPAPPPPAHWLRRPSAPPHPRLEQWAPRHDPGLERLPLRPVDQERHMAQRPRPLGPCRILIDAIENAGIAQVAIGSGETPTELFWTQSREHRQQRLPMGPHAAVVVDHLVEDARQGTIAR